MQPRVQSRLQSDINQKIQQAKQAGYSDAEINQYIAQTGLRPQAQARATQPQQRQGGFQPSALISEAGGLTGALSGGAAGAAIGSVVPVVGTAIGGVIGAGLGGFLGGTGGSAVEQQVRDKKVDTRKALTEGAIEGVFAAGPLRLLRGGKALAKGAKTGFKGFSVADDLSQALVGTTTRAGQATTGAARGIRTGAKVGGERLRPKAAQEINEFLTKTVKTKAASPATQLEDLAKFQNNVVSQLDNTVEKFNKTLKQKDKIFITNKLGKSFSDNIAGATNSQRELASQLAKEISEKGSLKDLNDYIKLLDNQINFSRPQDAVSSQREQVFRLFRKELRDAVTDPDVIPGLKNIKSNLAKAYQAEELLLESAGRLGSAFNPLGARVPNRLIQGAQARVGRGLERVGGALDSTSPLAAALRVGAGSQVASGLSSGQEVAQLQQTEPTFAGDLTEQDMFSQLTGALGGQQQMQQQMQQPQSILSQEDINQAILTDLQATGGKNIEAIQMIAQMYGPQAQQTQQPQLTAKQQESMTKYDDVESSLNLLEKQFMLAGGGQGIKGLAVRNVGSKIPGVASEARNYEGVRESLIAPLARAISGEVGVLTDRDIKRAEGLLPKLTDTPQEAQRRLQNLRNILQERRNNILMGAQ
jgi:hypothetical protein